MLVKASPTRVAVTAEQAAIIACRADCRPGDSVDATWATCSSVRISNALLSTDIVYPRSDVHHASGMARCRPGAAAAVRGLAAVSDRRLHHRPEGSVDVRGVPAAQQAVGVALSISQCAAAGLRLSPQQLVQP